MFLFRFISGRGKVSLKLTHCFSRPPRTPLYRLPTLGARCGRSPLFGVVFAPYPMEHNARGPVEKYPELASNGHLPWSVRRGANGSGARVARALNASMRAAVDGVGRPC